MSAGLAGSKVLLLVGAGAASTYVIQNPYVSDLIRDIAKVVAGHLKEKENDEDGGASSETAAALTAQVRRLTQELRQLATMQNRPVVISHESGGGTSVLSLVIPTAVLGSAAYGYMWWKGIHFSDLMYVTRRGMSQAVESFSKQMNTLSAALSTTRKQLTGRIDNVSKTLDDSVQVQLAIKKDVSSVHKVVENVDGEVKTLRTDVLGLEGKIDQIQQISMVAAEGIGLLCQFVSQGGRQQNVEKLNKLSSTITALTRSLPAASSASSLASSSLAGLAGLKDFASDGDLLVPNGTPNGTARHMLSFSPGMNGSDAAAAGEAASCATAPVFRRSVSSSKVQSTPRAVSRLDYRAESITIARSPEASTVTLTEVTVQDNHRSQELSHGDWSSPEHNSSSLSTAAAVRGQRGPCGPKALTPSGAGGVSSFTPADLSFPPRRVAPSGMPPVNYKYT